MPFEIGPDGQRVATSDDAIALAHWRSLHNGSDTEPLVPRAQLGDGPVNGDKVAWYWISTGYLPDAPETVSRALMEASGGEATWSPAYVSAAAQMGTVLLNTQQRDEASMAEAAAREDANQKAVAALLNAAEPYNAEPEMLVPAPSLIQPALVATQLTDAQPAAVTAAGAATAPAKKNYTALYAAAGALLLALVLL